MADTDTARLRALLPGIRSAGPIGGAAVADSIAPLLDELDHLRRVKALAEAVVKAHKECGAALDASNFNKAAYGAAVQRGISATILLAAEIEPAVPDEEKA